MFTTDKILCLWNICSVYYITSAHDITQWMYDKLCIHNVPFIAGAQRSFRLCFTQGQAGLVSDVLSSSNRSVPPKNKLQGTFWMSHNESVSKLMKEPGVPGFSAHVQIRWRLLAWRICSSSASCETPGKIPGVTLLVVIINSLVYSALLKRSRRLYKKSHLLSSALNSVWALLLMSTCHPSSLAQDCA